MKTAIVWQKIVTRGWPAWFGLGFLVIAMGMPITPLAIANQGSPIDLMFVIDNSGSMRKNDPAFITPKMVRTFAGRLPDDTRAGMVLFDQTVRLAAPLAPVASVQAQQRMNAAIAGIDYSGRFTNSAVAIERALYELRSRGRKEARKGIVFITDGLIDTGDAQKDRELHQWLKQDLAAESKHLGVPIFGIAFTEDADFILIQALATRTGGDYYRTYQASETLDVLEKILERLNPAPLPARPASEARTYRIPPVAPGPLAPLPAPAAQTDLDSRLPDILPGGATLLTGIVMPIVLLVLATALVFYIIQNSRKSRESSAASTRRPKAHLEDPGQVLGQGKGPVEITKERVTIGRDAKNDIHIDQATVSSFHATIQCKNMVYYLEDQRSTNGTRLNDRRLPPNVPARLKSGDSIGLATFSFRFVIPDQMPFGETVMVSMTALEGPESGSTMVIDLDSLDGKQGLINCMQNHLLQIHSMGTKYREFAGRYFGYETLDSIAERAHELLKKSQTDGRHHCEPLVRQNAFYLVCSLPVPIGAAADFFGAQTGGFIQFIMKWINSEAFASAHGNMVCIVTFGQDPATWVSLTIVPTHQEPDPVEIMSVDFLNEDEKAMLELDFDRNGRVI